MNAFPLSLLLAFALLWAGSTPGAAKEEKAPTLVFAASEYDPKGDADADLAKAQKIAGKEDRRILLLVGGNWCPWCRAFGKHIESNEAVKAVLAKFYVIQKVNVSDETSNTGFLNPYPAIDDYPHLFILDAKGKFLHSQGLGTFQKGQGYDEAAVVRMFKKWAR